MSTSHTTWMEGLVRVPGIEHILALHWTSERSEHCS